MSEPAPPERTEGESQPLHAEDQAPPSTSSIWHRPPPEMPEVLRQQPAAREPEAKGKKSGFRLRLVPETAGTDMRSIGLGLDFVAMVGAAILLGWLADRYLGTTQGVLIGLFVGLPVASWHLYKGALKINRSLERASKAPQRQQAPTRPPPTSLMPTAKKPATPKQTELDQPGADSDEPTDA